MLDKHSPTIEEMKFFISFEKNIFYIFEAKVKKLTALEDPSILWIKESKYQIISLNTKPVWYGHFLFSSLKEAKDCCQLLIIESFISNLRKNKIPFTDQDIEKEISTIEIKSLKG